jgi:glycerol kinase
LNYLLSIDQGTTSSRCIVFDLQGNAIATAQREFTQFFPQTGWVEHDAMEILDSVLDTLKEVIEKARISAEHINAIGITNQRETTVLWDRKTGKPVYPAIVWQSRQSLSVCERLRKEGREAAIREKTGLVLDAYFSASKVTWMLEQVDGLRERAVAGELAFGTIDTWLLWHLTNGKVHATDYSNASRTLLFNIHRLEWDAELLDWFGIPAALLPVVKDSSGFFGDMDAAILGTPIPICGIAGDQQAALFGQGCIQPGMAKNTYGTGCFMLMNSGNTSVQSQHGLLSTIAWSIDGNITYALEGSVFVAGSAVQWLRDGVGLFDHASETEAIALEVEDAGGVYFVPAFVGLGAPYWDPEARAAFFGLTRGTRRAHLVRAALEAMAYQTRDVFEAMQNDAGIALQSLKVDGGAAANNLLMQFQSDVLKVEVDRPLNTETTALGAALLAGLAAGCFSSIEACAQVRKANRVFQPQQSNASTEALYAGWKKAVKATMAYHP